MSRRSIHAGLSLLGITIIFVAVVLSEASYATLLVVVIGVLLLEAGVWKLADTFLPSDRRFHDLRREVRIFLEAIPRLNASAVQARTTDAPEDWREYSEILDSMREQVERMGRAAGRLEGQEETLPPEARAPGGGAGHGSPGD